MRVALDTNILAYAEGVNGAVRKKAALNIIEKLPGETTFLPVQVLGELFQVLTRKAERSPPQARAATHHLGIWDSVILSAAAAAGCRLLLSEDLHAGFTWSGVTVTNPFSKEQHELLADLLWS